MVSSITTNFCKSEDCPSSNELLEFQQGEVEQDDGVHIRKHLGSCEFCAAEVEFYSHYPQEDGLIDAFENIEIPAPLFELAEALLKNRHGDATSLDSLLQEQGGLVVDKV